MVETPAATILVAGGTPAAVEASARMLATCGFRVDTACTGEETLRMAPTLLPDLILLDRTMPDIDGVEVCRRIKADPRLANTFVLLASVPRAGPATPGADAETGADACIERPIDHRDLLPQVNACARIAVLSKQLRAASQSLDARTSELEQANTALVDARRAARKVIDDALRDKKLAEEALAALRSSEALTTRLLSAVEHSPATIVITDHTGAIEYVNPKFTRTTGYTAAEAIGQNPRILKSGDMPPEAYRAMWDMLASGKVWQGEFHNRRKDGSLYWELASISPLLNEKGDITHYVAVKEDVTEQRHQREQLARFAERAAVLLELPRKAESLPESELMAYAGGEAERLTESRVAFIHRVQEDQEHLELLTWSRRTLAEFCTASYNTHYPLAQAGIWAEAVRQRKPVIYNDYATAENKRGLPEDHAHLDRLISLPVVVEGKVHLVLGVGNRATDYTDTEVETLQLVGNELWRIISHRRADAALRKSEELMAQASRIAHIGAWELDLDRNLVSYSEEAGRLFDLEPGTRLSIDDALSRFGDARPQLEKALQDAMENGTPWDIEAHTATVAWRPVWIRCLGSAEQKDGKTIRVWGAVQDITERVQLREELLQSQKMESVGRLAGGIAHDFNNLLQAISGFTELLLLSMPANDTRRSDVNEIAQASERAAALTGQLLAFSRRQQLTLNKIDLNERIQSISSMLCRLMGEDIRLVCSPHQAPLRVRADKHQLDQVLLNLAVNARDAMPGGGRISLSTDIQELADDDPRLPAKQTPGRYARIAVADTGCGMTKTQLDHIFEPFFTTKPKGQGTGLGLAVVHGIVHQHAGFIQVESTPDVGTTFHIYLPLVTDTDPAAHIHLPASSDALFQGRGETLLVVEDAQGVRRFLESLLQHAGYRVFSAANVQEANRLYAKEKIAIQLVLSDVVLPDGNGVDLALKLQADNPNLPVLLASGYTDDRARIADIQGHGLSFLQKPYNASQVLESIRTLLATRTP